MSRVSTPFNAAAVSHKRNFTHIEPKGAYDAKETWWAQPTREAFMAARDAELPRMLKTQAIRPTAESGNTARQTFIARKVVSMFDRVRGGAE